jgi:hypothetical protein
MLSSHIVTYWRSLFCLLISSVIHFICGLADMLSVARKDEDGSVHVNALII